MQTHSLGQWASRDVGRTCSSNSSGAASVDDTGSPLGAARPNARQLDASRHCTSVRKITTEDGAILKKSCSQLPRRAVCAISPCPEVRFT